METVSPAQLPDRLPDSYTITSRGGHVLLKLPRQNPLFAVFALSAPLWLLGASQAFRDHEFGGVVSAGIGLALFSYASWPSLIQREIEIEHGRVTRRWTLLGGPGIFWRRHDHVRRVIITSKRRNAIDSTDAVWIEDGAGRHKIDSVTNSPEGSFRWFGNWQVGPAPKSPFYRFDRPTESVSPAILAVARVLTEGIGTGAVSEVER